MNSNINSDTILIELIKNQKKNVPVEKKLLYNDLKRISKYLTNSIFSDDCSLWSGYITVIKNDEKNSYINFYFNSKKYALHRLLFVNYIGELTDSEYIKFNCSNKGKCCNINHFYVTNKGDKNSSSCSTSVEPSPRNSNDLDDAHYGSSPDNKIIKKNIIVDFNL